ncbi:MAG TPA: hydroxysqualene dehydroxylase HpnE [Planctomycetaceae bacterium]|jgi:squalene-associated FAD-dependent desaturase|nr:hydroxysqualene dehydroxylase HpnE [Planctomycetaceae bacterium]
MTQRTVIVGGGLAGLAAAVALAQRGIGVTVLESRPRLGGRASSFVDKASGTQIDNCQHVSLGCCTNFQHFCRTVGLADLFRTESELFFIGPDNLVNPLSASALPAPFHCLGSFARLSYLTYRDLVRIGFGLRRLAAVRGGDSLALFDWLCNHRQTDAAIDCFWSPVLVSALSETLDRIDVASARKVFVDAFLANREGWRVQIPTVPLDVLYGERLVSWLGARGAAVRLQAGVERVVVENGRAVGALLRTGETVTADHVIIAVPHWIVLDLLPDECRTDCQLTKIGELESAPISSVHLWFDRPILFAKSRRRGQAGSDDCERELPHAVLVGRLSQWIFNRSQLQTPRHGAISGESAGEPGRPTSRSLESSHSYQVVISASRGLAANSQQETISKVVEELGEIFPPCRDAALLHSRLVTEHRAVFSVRPGAAECRPVQQTPLANLQLAGDWTRTGWPATMEGAVRSGYLAAENVLRQLGRAERIVQPDLPVSLLPRVLLGITA